MRILTRAIMLATVTLIGMTGTAEAKQHRPRATPMQIVARQHHWNAIEVADEWRVLWHESRSTAKHFNLWATNGDCVGSGQLLGPSSNPWSVYRADGGNASTELGQLRADANYTDDRYGTPIRAWEHEEIYGWY